MIKIIATDFEQDRLTGKVVSIKEFGAFVEFRTWQRRNGSHFQDFQRENQVSSNIF